MASRPAWSIKENTVVCEYFEFQWNGGFAITQKQKNIKALHQSIHDATQESALEISSKGLDKRGKEIGAFSLKLESIPLENVFQAAKRYEKGGPYTNLLTVTPKEAKRDERHSVSGDLIAFVRNGEIWPLEPKTAFYDYIYNLALVENYGKDLDLSNDQWFTDIEFNPNKSINCQARAVAIYKLLQQLQAFDVLESQEKWLEFHRTHIKS